MKKLVASIVLLIFIGCCPNDKKDYTTNNNIPFQFNIDTISRIEVVQDDSSYTIKDSIKLKLVINKINRARIDFIKFGSKDYFKIYNSRNRIIFKAYFRNNNFKNNGETYKCNEKIFE